MSVLDRLAEEAPSYHVFQAVRLVQEAEPQAVPIGYQGPVEHEVLRFRAELSLGFPGSDLVEARPPAAEGGSRRWEFTISFLGLYGPSSPLPAYFTEQLLGRERDGLTRGFLDLFHHRLVSLAYRSWAKHHPEAGREETRRLSGWLALALDAGTAATSALPLEQVLTHAGALSRTAPPAGVVARVLSQHLGMPVAIEECLARWTTIPEESRTRLRRSGRLGRDSVVGRAIFNRTTAFRVSLGPVQASELTHVLPGGIRHGQLVALLARLNADRLDCQVELVIEVGELPAIHLGKDGRALALGARLGGRGERVYRVRFMLPERIVTSN